MTLKELLQFAKTKERIDAGNIRQIKELCNCQMKHRLNKN